MEVQRLRGDRSDIVPGDVVAFVATAKFRIEQTGGLHTDFPELCRNTELFAINEDAQVSCTVPMHEKSQRQRAPSALRASQGGGQAPRELDHSAEYIRACRHPTACFWASACASARKARGCYGPRARLYHPGTPPGSTQSQ